MKISRKLSIGTVVSLVVLGTIALYAHYVLMLKGEAQSLSALGSMVGPVIEASLSHSMIDRDGTVLNETLKNLKGIEAIDKILVLDLGGTVKAGTDAVAIGKHLLRTDPAYWGSQEAVQWSPFRNKEKTYRWVQAVRNKQECKVCHSPSAEYNGSIVIDFSIESIAENVRTRIVRATLIFLTAFLGVGLIIFMLSNEIIIKRLTAVIDKIGKFKDGDYGARLPLAGNDELTRLSEQFNEMADGISNSQRELKQDADELLALAVSTNVVNAVPHSENLYEAACMVAVREMKITMVWIGLVKEESFDIHPAAQCGFEEGYLKNVRVTWDDTEAGCGPTGMAIKTRTPQIMNDFNHARYAVWRAEAGKRGYRSSAALPLLTTSGEVLGVLNVYSNEENHFSRKRMRMLIIFSNQVSAVLENRALFDHLEKSSAELARQLKITSRAQKEWQMTFDSITDMVSIHDKDFNILRANKAVRDYFGLAEEEIVQKKCYSIFHGTNCAHEACPHRRSMDLRQVVSDEIREDSGKLFRISAFPYYGEDGEFVGSVHVARDITNEKNTEMRLILSERLASLGQMASGVAHEINTPLASIAGCAEGLLRKVKNSRYEPKLFEEYLGIVEEEVQRCKTITTGMLSFVRNDVYEKKEIRINEALDKALEIISFQGRLREITIKRLYSAALPVIYGSDGELRQVFLTIIVNALDAMSDRGWLTLETAFEGESVVIKITDSGPGIASQDLNKIFDPFFTTKSDRGGTGLGLSIAHRIMTNHHGMISATSEEGKGTTFHLTLPVAASDPGKLNRSI